MSDKHIVETKLGQMFTEYRESLLPNVISNWNSISEEQKEHITTVHKFHCALHALANMATVCEDSIKNWEKVKSVTSGNFGSRGQSATYLFIKSMCNLFHKDGGGAPGEIQLLFHSRGIPVNKVPLLPFSGSRFNVLFYNAAGSFYVRDQVSLTTLSLSV